MNLGSRTIDVSVIMPVYRTKIKYLKKAVSSVLRQSLHDFEFIILNDSPEDENIRKIIKGFDASKKRCSGIVREAWIAS